MAHKTAHFYARETGRVDNAAYRSLNHTDTLTASCVLSRSAEYVRNSYLLPLVQAGHHTFFGAGEVFSVVRPEMSKNRNTKVTKVHEIHELY